MRPIYYILDDDNNPVPGETVVAWGRWLAEDENRRVVAKTKIGAEIEVSTIFLGIDHGFGFLDDAAPPILFETMVFGGPRDQEQWRYATWNEAKEGHEDAVRAVYREVTGRDE